jgi:hypothetical protein
MTESKAPATTRRKVLNWALALTFLLSFAYVLQTGSISKAITPADLSAIERLGVEKACSVRADFSSEIACIKAVQNSIRVLVPDLTCAPKGVLIEPYNFLTRGYGCCYDRARFTAKALSHFGFETRHAAIYDGDAYGLWGLLVPRIASHASTEVKTSKGWLGVDSVEPFLLMTAGGEVLTYRNFKSRRTEIRDPVRPDDFYRRDLIVVYGLYSRNGKFHGLNPVPVPEFNLRELIYNLFPG